MKNGMPVRCLKCESKAIRAHGLMNTLKCCGLIMVPDLTSKIVILDPENEYSNNTSK